MARESYNHREIEQRSQELWASLNLNATDLTDTTRDPYYLLCEFPYPSGDLHTGHWYAFGVTDIYARFQRMQGKNVLFPIGFDAFGLPAENAAIKRGLDPKEWTYQNMETMTSQLKSMGASFDWSKKVVTCDPEYYKWTQWLFAKLYEHNLAYRAEASVKWCPQDQTVLANEQVTDGKCERCGHEVEEKLLTQWFLKITEYADRLLTDLDALPWREDIKDAQRAWIGKSEGAKLRFQVLNEGNALAAVSEAGPQTIEVFTTRPDTIFGVTYVVLAPEHPLVDTLLPVVSNADAVMQYRAQTVKKTERERSENKEKTGIALEGVRAINPATAEEIPVFVADYVLASYGTGAVMAVPAHDERDHEFAKKHGLPMRDVVIPSMVDKGNPPVEGKESVTRTLALAIVRNPKDDTYLCLKWPKTGWTTFVTGGVDEGEDLVEAAKREIAEETGYTNVTFVRSLGTPVQTQFFAAHKDQNRIAYGTSLLFDLVDDTTIEVASEEADQHVPAWLTLEEIRAADMRHAEIDLIIARLAKEPGAYTDDGVLYNSGAFTGRGNQEAMAEIVEAVGGERTTNYRLRDWLVSRQRYWGCPIPVVYDPEGLPHLVPSEHLPWTLPADVDFTAPNGKSPLATSKELAERVERIFGEGWTPEYDTLDTFVDSSWYYLRYLDPKDADDFSDQALMKAWLPVDRYSGGSEHTTMHLLYARFFYKALHDLALVPTAEPFYERMNRGLILGPDGQKMSKSKGNVVNPDEFVQKYGADAVRMYLAFIGPYNEPGHYPWKPEGVESMRRFLDRLAALAGKVGDADPALETERAVAKAAEKVSADTDRFKTNTAVSALMVLVNHLEELLEVPRASYLHLLVLLAPYAPHLAEHLYQNMREGLVEPPESVHQLMWPAFDPSLLASELVTVIVQIAGKKRGELSISASATEEEALQAAKELPGVAAALGESAPSRIIYVPGRILNLVP